MALWDACARDGCAWRAAVHRGECTGVALAAGGWAVSCCRDGCVVASHLGGGRRRQLRACHLGGGRRRQLRAAGGGPAQRCVAAAGGAAVSVGDGGAVWVWDLGTMALGGTVAAEGGHAVHALHVHHHHHHHGAAARRSLLLGLADGSVETWVAP